MAAQSHPPWGYRWRSSKPFIISTVIIALFCDTFLYGFLVPILSYMLEARLRIDPSETQHLTTALLGCHGFLTLTSAPIIAYFADKTPDRKIHLLTSLAACLAGTVLVAWSPYLWALFLGRFVQAVAGSAAWIFCFTVLSDTVGMQHMGKVMGVAMSFVTAGVVGGPMIAGSMLQLVGYWPAWSAPLVLLVLDMMARLVMIQEQDSPAGGSDSRDLTEPSSSPTTAAGRTTSSDVEPSTVSSSRPLNYQSISPGPTVKGTEGAPPSRGGFYRIMFRDARVLVGVANSVTFSAIVAGFDATLPIHLHKVFGWGSLPVGMTFLAFQIPSILLAPLVGCLRDRVGLRYPTVAGWALMVPLLWLLGIPGQSHSTWGNIGYDGRAMFIVCIAAIGTASTLVRGAGALQMTGPPMTAVVHDMQTKNPRVFGDYGGSSRVFSMTEISFSLGMMVGPLLSGLLSEAVGYYYMNLTLGELTTCLAPGPWPLAPSQPADSSRRDLLGGGPLLVLPS
ncbi:Major facilitator superfamily domain, general substrate transporter [Metarhizium album ARSEF 1941]|uniref:Major facilitator superfamily domain, general substrate transporter n=1 Tax=Metarhizium album (strain ARSEF 1941) TaxID=1081103 RepID=A0A0B2WL75_METAS|nr:Major facilitator superfamily domain, general substrate transporter [Metarhizium album ARSEF 1941]KHN93745.1 Major facilitator superfamily domain, general substrate transporter [Metarhizium album ARSEF 1941]